MRDYENKLKQVENELDDIRSMAFEDEHYIYVAFIAEYMIERIEYHKIQYDKYGDEETKNHINLLFKDIQSLFNNSRLN
ncbi:hypothetical protein KUT38_25820 [Pseudomonas aeruginosa]|nr:hypothetical protein [Pseudomonas aeruginosa]HCF3532570.1 hypothetical protein [Pseudomonas aeruginosa]HEK3273878.1 hypothetical protein [Pseudomonas aeruginosa]